MHDNKTILQVLKVQEVKQNRLHIVTNGIRLIQFVSFPEDNTSLFKQKSYFGLIFTKPPPTPPSAFWLVHVIVADRQQFPFV